MKKCISNYLSSKFLWIAVLTAVTRRSSSSATLHNCPSSISLSGWIKETVGDFSWQSTVVIVLIGLKTSRTCWAAATSSLNKVYLSLKIFFFKSSPLVLPQLLFAAVNIFLTCQMTNSIGWSHPWSTRYNYYRGDYKVYQTNE